MEEQIQKMRHQIKNDFNMLSSMMLLQSDLSKDNPVVYEILQQNINRIKVIGLLYEQAYHYHNADIISLKAYIEAIVWTIRSAYVGDLKIQIDTHIMDTGLQVEKAQACGLIICEALTNSLRHAFVYTRKGNVVLSITQTDAQMILRVDDDGIGLPPAFDIEFASSFGLQLIKSFASQLNAKLKITSDHGTSLHMVFEA